jgi:diguanylate cyclase (GGDEF)-like protein
MLMDLNRFKEINDTLGHPIGDLLLEQASRRLSAHIRQGDIVAVEWVEPKGNFQGFTINYS